MLSDSRVGRCRFVQDAAAVLVADGTRARAEAGTPQAEVRYSGVEGFFEMMGGEANGGLDGTNPLPIR